MKKKAKIRIVSFRDLEVYQNTYRSSILVMTKVIPRLPESEKYDLKDQLSRASKAVPRLIAEGYAKRHQVRGFQKYLDDAMAECNEIIVCLEQCKDIYPKLVDINLGNELIDLYDKSGRQLYNLSLSWSKFKEKKRNRKT
ncbi:four helix bundle protein [Patescibacteria group bacterium]